MPKPTPIEGLTGQTALRDATKLLVEARLLDVRRYEAQLRDPPYPQDPIHDMRVATRRLREALHILGSHSLRAHEAAVKRLQDALGEVRDAQLLGKWLRGQRLAELAHARERTVEKTSRALAKALARWTERTAPGLLEALGEEKRKGKLGGAKVGARIRKRLSTVSERIDPVLLAPRPLPAHALRKAVKKLRYASELGAPAFEVLEALQDALEPLQESLGELHDEDVRLALIRRTAPERLIASERERRAALAERLVEDLAAFRASGIEKKVRKAL